MKEEEVVEALKQENEEFRKLDEEHRKLGLILSDLNRKFHLTAAEEVERKKIQKLKLSKKDRMAELVREYRKNRLN